MKVTEIAFTGYPVTDLKRSRQFYEVVLSLKPSHVSGDDSKAWVEYDIGPGTLAITNGAPDWKPSAGGGAVALEVDDFNEIHLFRGDWEHWICKKCGTGKHIKKGA